MVSHVSWLSCSLEHRDLRLDRGRHVDIAYFVDCVEQGGAPEQGTGAQARAALTVSLAAARSLESGRPEDV
jgi:predicted dehydrogenase